MPDFFFFYFMSHNSRYPLPQRGNLSAVSCLAVSVDKGILVVELMPDLRAG